MEPRNNGVPDWRVERQVKESAMIGTTLSLAAGYLAMIEADSGNARAAEATMAANRRFIEYGCPRPCPGFVRARLSAGIPGLLRLSDDRIRLRCLRAGFRGARLRDAAQRGSRVGAASRADQERQSPAGAAEKPFAGGRVSNRGRSFVSAGRLRRSGRGDQEGARDPAQRSRHAPWRRSATQRSS